MLLFVRLSVNLQAHTESGLSVWKKLAVNHNGDIRLPDHHWALACRKREEAILEPISYRLLMI